MVQSPLQSALEPEMTNRANTYQPSSQGPCCDRDCRFNVGNQCREDNGCRDESYCDGRGTACPPSILKPNKTVCNEEFVCFQVTLMMMLLRIELRSVVTKILFIRASARVPYAWPTDLSLVSVGRVPRTSPPRLMSLSLSSTLLFLSECFPLFDLLSELVSYL